MFTRYLIVFDTSLSSSVMSELSLVTYLSLKHNASLSFNPTEHSFMLLLTAAIICYNSSRKQLTDRFKIFKATETLK